MEQLINAAKTPYYTTAMLFILGATFIVTGLFVFVAVHGNVREEAKTIMVPFVIGSILLVLSVYCKNIYSRNNDQTKSIVKNIVAKEYPDSTDFCWILDTGSFTDNGTEYKIKYQKTVNNNEKLIVTVKKEQSKDKNVKMLDIPKEKLK